MVFVQACMILDEKASISSFCIVLKALFKSVRPMVWFAAVSLPTESSAWWHANKCDILYTFKEADNSSISLSLITFMIPLMVSMPRVNGTQDDQGHLILIVASHPFYLNPYDNIAQGSRE